MENAEYQRLSAVKNFLQFKTFADFARAIQLKNQQIFTDIKQGKHGISAKLADKICSYNSEISFEWLTTGRGKMTNNTQTIGDISNSTVQGVNVNEQNGGAYETLLKIVETNQLAVSRFQSQTEKFQEQIDRLITIIERKYE